MNIVDEYLQFCKRLRCGKGKYVHSGLTKQKLRMFHKWQKQWQRTLKGLDKWGEYDMNTCITHTPSDTSAEEEEQYREMEQWLNQWLHAPRRYSAEARTWTIYWERVDEE